MKELRGDHNQCPTCGEYFTTTSNFDRHRKGPMSDRKCCFPATVGLIQNQEGFWHLPGSDKAPRRPVAQMQEGA